MIKDMLSIMLSMKTLMMLLLVTVKVKSTENQFTTRPMSVIQAEGLNAVFECLYPGALAHGWRIGDEFPAENEYPPDMSRLPSSGDSPASLTIPAIPQYNNTVVQCEAVVRMGRGFESVLSENATLLVQGVSSIDLINSMYSISLSWTDHNFTTTITYCVDVVQIFGSTDLISSECGLNLTQFTFSSPGHGPCGRFNFTVTPTDGVMNGTSSEPVTGFFNQAIGMGGNTSVSEGQNMDDKDITFTGMVPDCFSPTTYEVESDILDTPLSGSLSSSLPLSFSLPTDMRTNVTVTLTDDNGVGLLFENIPTSMYDIETAIADSSYSGAINTSCEFVPGTRATGYLAIITRKSCNGRMNDTIIFTEYDTTNRPYTLNGAGAGDYNVAFFDLEANGFPRYTQVMDQDRMYIGAASIQEVSVQYGSRTQTHTNGLLGDASLRATDNNICVTCPTGCLALVYGCNNIDIAVSVMVSAFHEQCINLGHDASGSYTAALFPVNNNMMPRQPGKQMDFLFTDGSPSSATTLSANALFVFSCVVYYAMVACLFQY